VATVVRRLRKPPQPFTVPHFRAWAADLLLDTEQPFRPEHFQEVFLRDVFSGVREAWLVVPEGNGKTTLMAALALYHCEYRPHAAVSIAAASREQAEIMYRQAEGFVLRTPRLHELIESPVQKAKGKKKLLVPRFVCLEGYRRVNHFGGGRIQVFAADDRTGDGIIPTFGLIDEPHRQRDLSLYRTWAGKLEKRDGQIVAISTAGEPGSDFETTREAIRKSAETVTVRGSFTRSASPGMVLHEWAIAADEKPDDFRAVKRANPFSGITVPKLRAKYNRPTMTMQHWLRFVCNRPTRSVAAAVEESEWRNAGTPPVMIPPGVPIWLGLDVAWKWDTTSAVPLWWRDQHWRVLGPATILVPPRDGTSLDPASVEKALTDLHARNPVHTVVMDMSRAEQLAQWIGDTLGATVVDRPQSNVFAAEDYERFMEALRSGWLKHSGDAGLTAHVLNAITRVLPAGNARFDRPAEARVSDQQERRVIDALSAASMVHAVAAQPAEAIPEPAILGLLRGIVGPLPDRAPVPVAAFPRLLGSHEVASP
jgi:phage terminase large subunit-like protein